MSKISLTINSRKITANPEATILEVAEANNIYVPKLCNHPDLKPVGVCRICLVEVAGKGIVTSCNTKIAEGMNIKTDTPEIEKIRRLTVELLLVNHEGDCLECPANTNCELQNVANYVGIDKHHFKRLIKPERNLHVDDSNPFFKLDNNKCIQCGICIRTCDEITACNVIEFAKRGIDSVVTTFANKPLTESNCKSCAECAIRCPTGAMSLKTHDKPAYEVKTTCPYCGCGCEMYLGVRGNKIVSSRGVKENPANQGNLCVKGRFGYEFVNHPDRLTTPLIKKNGKLVKATWDEALTLIAKKLGKYKGNKFALLASAKATNEDNYALQKFTRAVMGTNNVDHCARLCHAPTVAGLKQSFGSGAMTNNTQDIGKAKCIFAIGTNTTDAHPIIALQVKYAAKKGTLIVANPRKIDLVRHAKIFLQHNPGSDVALMMGMARVIVDEKLLDKKFIESKTEGFAEFKKSLTNFDLETAEKITGVPKDKIAEAARIYATSGASSILFAMGITQHTHGTDNVLATSNLALLTGNIGKEGAGVNPLRGQNNVQGACDLGSLPNVYPGYQAVNNADVHKKFEKAWKAKLSDKAGLTHLEIFEAIDSGKVKCLYTAGENPVLSEADSNHVIAAIKKLEFFITQDIFLTETAQLADVVLPAATFAEKEGSFTNTERRVQRVRKVIEPIGEAKADWKIMGELAAKMGVSGLEFNSAAEIMDEIAAVSPIYHGISFKRLEKTGGLQWPCLDAKHPGTPILHVGKFATASGKGIFKPLEYKPSAELPDKEYPLVLTTDRSIFHFHTATMSRKVKGLEQLRSHEVVRINPIDAKNLKITDGQKITVVSRRGRVTAAAKITDTSSPGVIAMTFHFAESPTNQLTNAARDPIAKIPETKVCAVRIET